MDSQGGFELDYDEKVNKEIGSSWIIIKHIIRNALDDFKVVNVKNV